VPRTIELRRHRKINPGEVFDLTLPLEQVVKPGWGGGIRDRVRDSRPYRSTNAASQPLDTAGSGFRHQRGARRSNSDGNLGGRVRDEPGHCLRSTEPRSTRSAPDARDPPGRLESAGRRRAQFVDAPARADAPRHRVRWALVVLRSSGDAARA
jgi:hypothetical protein